MGFDFPVQEEEKYIMDLISVFNIVHIYKKIADIVIDIRKKRRIKLQDAIIAATAISLDLQLVTRNVDDFENINIRILNPFD